MTKFETARCAVCRVRLSEHEGPGRPRSFCSAACRQRHWVASQGSSDTERAEEELRHLRDDLEAVLDDVATLLDALDAEWELDPADPMRRILGERSATATVPLRQRLRR